MKISKRRKTWGGEIESSIEILPENERVYSGNDDKDGVLVETGIEISIIDFEFDCECDQRYAVISLNQQEEAALRNYLNEREEQRRALLA